MSATETMPVEEIATSQTSDAEASYTGTVQSNATQTAPTNALLWFEIPTSDLDRAQTFYETLLAVKLMRGAFGDPNDEMCVFPAPGRGVAGALVHRRFQLPADGGTMVYLNVDGQLDAVLERVRTLNTDLLAPKTAIPSGGGFFACVRDSEGNHVGLCSRSSS
jgi:predicted enzyme related to lactoylglutathione lyase